MTNKRLKTKGLRVNQEITKYLVVFSRGVRNEAYSQLP